MIGVRTRIRHWVVVELGESPSASPSRSPFGLLDGEAVGLLEGVRIRL